MVLHPLSKSQYLKGRHCIRRVWLYNWHRELMQPPSEVQQSIFQQGHDVGRLAHQLFPGGIEITEDHNDPAGALSSTQVAIQSGAPAVFEAAFEFDSILIRTDILAKNNDGSWSLHEVKSSTKVKDEHFQDVAVQKYVLDHCGFNIRNANLIHLNHQFVRQGEISPEKLFTTETLDRNDKFIEAYAEIPIYLARIRDALAKDEVPEQMLGSICKNPYECEFKSHCWASVPANSIHYLVDIRDKKREALLSMGIDEVGNIPDSFALSENQRVQVHAERLGKAIIDYDAIKKHLQELSYPLWFVDFETVGFAIPAYDGTKPYEHLPFQFSLHVQAEPGGSLEHHEFLFDEKSDSRRNLAATLCSLVGDEGSIIAYHASFEAGRIKELAQLCPELSTKLQSMLGRIWDLEKPFAERWYCHPQFHGRSSLKSVLPVVVPELSYDDMEIGKGDLAQLKYTEMLDLLKTSEAHRKIKKDLLAYCGQDTFAMVKILAVLTRQIALSSNKC